MTDTQNEETDTATAIRAYLESLKPEWVAHHRDAAVSALQKRLDEVEQQISDKPDDVMANLLLSAERHRLRAALNSPDMPDRSALEAEFVRRAAGFARQHDIGWPAWRDMGVSPQVLRSAGIDRAGATQPAAGKPAAGKPSAGRPPGTNNKVTEGHRDFIVSTIERRGPFVDPTGRATQMLGSYTAGRVTLDSLRARLVELEQEGRIEREVVGKRTRYIGVPGQR